VGTLNYLWSDGQTTQTATGLCAGTYSLTITDSNNCTTIDSLTITDPSPISITLSTTSPTCNGDCDATALATASGGTPSYTYSWNTSPSQNNSLATSLCAGNYTVTVTDNNGCIDSATANIINPTLLSTTTIVTNASCNGVCDGVATTTPNGGVAPYTYLWSNDDSTVVSGPTCGLCDGSATSTPFGGTGSYTFVWTDPNTGSTLLTTTSQSSSTIMGLCAGILNLNITDDTSGCSYNYTIIVNSSTGPNVTITTTGETCTSACDGTASTTVIGGTTPYTYQWTPSGGSGGNASNLCAGPYSLTVTDSIGCVTIDTFTITTTGLILTITNVTPESCFNSCDGTATVSVSSGLSPYIYQWSPNGGTNATGSPLCAGNFVVTVTDLNNCSDSIRIHQEEMPLILIYGMTPWLKLTK